MGLLHKHEAILFWGSTVLAAPGSPSVSCAKELDHSPSICHNFHTVSILFNTRLWLLKLVKLKSKPG